MNNVLLVVNTGTPDAPDRKSVSRYLSEFLNDPMVMDMPAIARKILVNLIIVPFRASHSSDLYRRLWTSEGSPLLINLEKLVAKLRLKSHDWQVIGAMRYGKPSLEETLRDLGKSTVNKLTILPLYPQFAQSTTGTVNALVDKMISEWDRKPEIRFIEEFYSDAGFISAYANKIRKYDPQNSDHLLFSFHSLPARHIRKIHPGQEYNNCECTVSFPEHGMKCYRAQCYETARRISAALGLEKDRWSVSFQSRLTRSWTGPFTDSVLSRLAAEGRKRVLVAAPSFTADCLETKLEIGQSYRDLFIKAGGKELQLCESLNDDDEWVEAIIKMIS
jgi:ferrochelatase